MWKVLLEAVLGRRNVRALRRLLAGITLAVMIFVPGAAAAIVSTVVHEEQARITPLLEQMVRHLSQHSLDHGRLLHLPHAVQQYPHH